MSKYGSKLLLLSVSAEQLDFVGFRASKNFSFSTKGKLFLKELSVAKKKVLRVQVTRFFYDQKEQDGVLSLDGPQNSELFFAGGKETRRPERRSCLSKGPRYSSSEPPFLQSTVLAIDVSVATDFCCHGTSYTFYLGASFINQVLGQGLEVGCHLVYLPQQPASLSVQDNLTYPLLQEADFECTSNAACSRALSRHLSQGSHEKPNFQ